MQNTQQIVHSNQSFSLPNGLAMLRYVGLKYPQSEWAGLLDKTPDYETKSTEIGHIILQAEGSGPLYEVERKLLAMARIHGAHMVYINFIKSFERKKTSTGQGNNCVYIYGSCQRFDL